MQRWFRQRKQAEQPSTLQKFCETGWRFVFYTCIFVYGLLVLWSKHWFWDINGCWVDYPKHKVRCFLLNMFVSTCDKCLFESLLIMPQRNIVIDNTNNILDRIQNDTNLLLDFCGCLALLHVGVGVLLVPVLQPVL